MKLKEIVLEFISGDWGAESKSLKNPCKIRCIRGADFQPLQTNGKLGSAPIRYVAGNSLSTKEIKKRGYRNRKIWRKPNPINRAGPLCF